jgi:hypothetical protein
MSDEANDISSKLNNMRSVGYDPLIDTMNLTKLELLARVSDLKELIEKWL